MAKIGIFYGSSTGYTADVAMRVAKALGVDIADVHDVAATEPSALGEYDVLVLGTSTWGAGDLQDSWEDFIAGAEALSLGGKKAAIFGCGDENMSDTFCNGIGIIYRRLQPTGLQFIAPYNADGYTFSHSGAQVDGVFVGMPLDEVNHADLTDGKIAEWTALIKEAIK